MGRRYVSHYTTDMRDFPSSRDAARELPAVTRRWIDRLGSIVEAATAFAWQGIRMETVLPCWGREETGPCTGSFFVTWDEQERRIDWNCPRCDMGGVITGFEGTPFDLSKVPLGSDRPPEEWPRVTLHFLEHDLLLRMPGLPPRSFRVLRSAEWVAHDVRITAPAREFALLL